MKTIILFLLLSTPLFAGDIEIFNRVPIKCSYFAIRDGKTLHSKDITPDYCSVRYSKKIQTEFGEMTTTRTYRAIRMYKPQNISRETFFCFDWYRDSKGLIIKYSDDDVYVVTEEVEFTMESTGVLWIISYKLNGMEIMFIVSKKDLL